MLPFSVLSRVEMAVNKEIGGRNSKRQDTSNAEPDFKGAAIINEDGSETPITEDMIQTACEQLDPETSEANTSEN
tara:strand:+ start:50 stop:274 length:225 start_codon:yes stop_codon:yes gene_type:complete